MASDDTLTPITADRFSVVLSYDPMMVAELALGADDPYDIAERYGLEPDAYERLSTLDWFERLVAQKRHEFHDTGALFTAKAGMMAEALLTRLFQQSMIGSIAAPLTVEVAKQLTDIGRLKPQPQNMAAPQAGSGFQINIQVNGADVINHASRLQPAPIDVTPTTFTVPLASSAQTPPGVRDPSAPQAPDTLPVASTPPATTRTAAPLSASVAAGGVAMSLPPPPAYISNLRVPDFDVRHPGAASLAGAASMAAVPSLAQRQPTAASPGPVDTPRRRE